MKRFSYRSRLLGVAFSAGWLLPLFASAASPATTPTTARPQYQKSLAPDDIKVIQDVAQGLLSMRQGAAVDPAQETMSKQLKELGTELDRELTSIAPPTVRTAAAQQLTQAATVSEPPQLYPKTITLPDGTTLPVKGAPSSSPSPKAAVTALQPLPVADATAAPGGNDHFAGVRAHLKAIDSNQKTITAMIRPNAASTALDAHLQNKTMTLRNEIDTALANAAKGDLAAIKKLRDRLKPKTLNQEIAERNANSAVTGGGLLSPSITTLTRHR